MVYVSVFGSLSGDQMGGRLENISADDGVCHAPVARRHDADRSERERKSTTNVTDLEDIGLLERGLHVALQLFIGCLEHLAVH